jgi:hypothetical protein
LDARYASLFSRTHFWDRCGVRISGKPSDEMLKAVELRVREHGWKSTDGDCAEPDLQRGAKCAADARKAASAVRSELVESYGDLNGVRTAYEQVIEAEAARRQRHVNLLKSLADLPQLFIAV